MKKYMYTVTIDGVIQTELLDHFQVPKAKLLP